MAGRFTPNRNTMKLRMGILGVTLTLLLGGTAALTPRAQAQETAAESVKRKVKIKVVPEYPPLAKQMNVTGRVKIEAVLFLYAKGHPEDVRGIEKVLRFRRRVREEFDRLVRASEKPAPIAQLPGV